jgi:ferrous iron transport protein B
MNCHGGNNDPSLFSTDGTIILVGNHNVGKSVLFGWLTGTYVTVANYPGTTVEVTRGSARFDGHRTVVDTPGVNSLQPISEDERVTRDVLLDESPGAVVQVADAKNLRRALLITSQLADMQVPLVVALNMMDEARARHIAVNVDALSQTLAAPVIPTTATEKQGLDELASHLASTGPVQPLVQYEDNIENAIDSIAGQIVSPRARSMAIMFLAGDRSMESYLRAHVAGDVYAGFDKTRLELQAQTDTPLATLLQDTRTRWIDSTVRQVYSSGNSGGVESLSHTLARWTVHPLWGLPILLLVLLGMYMFVGKFGAGTLVNYIEGTVFGEWINPFVSQVVRGLIPFELVQDFLVGKYGVITVALTYGFAIILPIVFTFFLAFGLLEDSGYLPRLAVMADRIFRAMGLNGKAVLPMVLGLGCDTMATMTTRTLETKKDRILVTLLLALGVPCSAQLGVVLGMLAGLDMRATLIWTGVVAFVLIAVGWLAARVIPGSTSDFILELPPLRVPKVSHLAIKTMARIEWYLKEVLPLFIAGTIVLFVLDKLNVLNALERAADPLIVNWLGLPAQATEAFLVGFLRRDYGAAGFFLMAREGLLSPDQILVALVTITLFVPCIANFFVMVKERGMKTALAMTAFIFPFAFFIGGVLNWVLRLWS